MSYLFDKEMSGDLFDREPVVDEQDVVEVATETLYIVPAWSDMAGQCRIVARAGKVSDARKDYQQNPEAWREVGLMASNGSLRCLSMPQGVSKVIREVYEPLMAGLQLEVVDGVLS